MTLDVLVVDLGALLTVGFIVWYFRLLGRR
jgi:hypothetical protein